MMFAPKPANDDFAAASVISGSGPSFTASGTTAGGTIEDDEPELAFFPDPATSTWHRWTPTADGLADIGFTSNSFTSPEGFEAGGAIAIYEGSALDELELVDAAFLSSNQGHLRWETTAGTEYHVLVTGPGEGPYALKLDSHATPANDDLADATALSGAFPIARSGDLLAATDESSEPDHGGDSGGHTVWFSFNPEQAGTYRLNACGTGSGSGTVSSALAVYTGPGFGSLNQVASTAGDTACALSFNASAGTTYLVALADHDGSDLDQGARYSLTLGRESVVATVPPGGGTVSTGQDATPQDSAQVGVTSPGGGQVSLTKSFDPETPPGGYQFLGAHFSIEAPNATAAAPLVLEFTLDASLLPPGSPPASAFEVFRDGELIEDCTGAAGVAAPDPCVAARTTVAGGDLLIRVLSSHASEWDLAFDGVAPLVNITQGPSAFNIRQPTFTFAANEPGSTFECRIDGGPLKACTSPYKTPPLSDGRHVLEIRATDSAENVGEPSSLQITIDATAPETTITKGTKKAKKGKAKFEFKADESNVTFKCAIDKAKLTSCKSPYKSKKLKKGKHKFTVQAIDALGNVDASPATKSFKVPKKKKKKHRH